MSDSPLDEVGWWRKLAPEDREALRTEARQRVAESMDFTAQQDAKVVAIFGLSVALLSISGLFGNFVLALAWETPLTVSALIITAATWYASWQAYHPRMHFSGVDVSMTAHDLATKQVSGPESRGLELEALVESYQANIALSFEKGYWLDRMLKLIALQAVTLVMVELGVVSLLVFAPLTAVAALMARSAEASKAE